MSSPPTTIIIPTHNHAESLGYSIASVLQQSVADFSLVVIGDGVGDDSRDVVADMVRSDSRVSFVDRPKTPRHGESIRHEVITASDSDVIAYQGDDDLWLPNHLKVMLQLLADADFVHPLAIEVQADGTLSYSPTDLSRPECLAWHLSEKPQNAVSLTGVAHSRSSYLQLPWGWRETPPGTWTDLYMWQQFFRLDGLKARTSHLSTTVKLAAHGRGSMTAEQRSTEIAGWWTQINDDAGFDRRWTSDVERAMRHSGVSMRLSVTALENQVSYRIDERDATQRQLETSEHELENLQRLHSATTDTLANVLGDLRVTRHALDTVRESTSWRLTKPCRRSLDAWRSRGKVQK